MGRFKATPQRLYIWTLILTHSGDLKACSIIYRELGEGTIFMTYFSNISDLVRQTRQNRCH